MTESQNFAYLEGIVNLNFSSNLYVFFIVLTVSSYILTGFLYILWRLRWARTKRVNFQNLNIFLYFIQF